MKPLWLAEPGGSPTRDREVMTGPQNPVEPFWLEADLPAQGAGQGLAGPSSGLGPGVISSMGAPSSNALDGPNTEGADGGARSLAAAEKPSTHFFPDPLEPAAAANPAAVGIESRGRGTEGEEGVGAARGHAFGTPHTRNLPSAEADPYPDIGAEAPHSGEGSRRGACATGSSGSSSVGPEGVEATPLRAISPLVLLSRTLRRRRARPGVVRRAAWRSPRERSARAGATSLLCLRKGITNVVGWRLRASLLRLRPRNGCARPSAANGGRGSADPTVCR